MTSELIDELHEEFHWMPCEERISDNYRRMRDGWFILIRDACQDIDKCAQMLGVQKSLRVTSIRERLGLLEFDIRPMLPELEIIVQKTLATAKTICMVCGRKGYPHDINGFYIVACKECASEIRHDQLYYRALLKLYDAIKHEKAGIVKTALKKIASLQTHMSRSDIAAAADPESPLSAAAKMNSIEIIDLLIKSGEDINGADPNGWTPLMNAAKKGREDIVRALLNHGADIKLKAEGRKKYHGKTALEIAEIHGNIEIVQILTKCSVCRLIANPERK